jgi:hypothetical protein
VVRRDHRGTLATVRRFSFDAHAHAYDAHQLLRPPPQVSAPRGIVDARIDETQDQRAVQRVREQAKPAQAAARAARVRVNG